MPLTRRYSPEFAPGENSMMGIDFSFVLPPGAAIASGAVEVWTNSAAPALAPEWTVGPVQISGTAVYARFTGGTEGRDYQIRWVVQDSEGNNWPRTAMVLVAITS